MQINKHNMLTEHNVATLLVEKMFTNYNSSDIYISKPVTHNI